MTEKESNLTQAADLRREAEEIKIIIVLAI